jgi:hypothetical protein
MAHTDKIFLLESHTDIKLSDANKNISFGLDGNIFACEYISRLELDRIYGEVFQGVSRWFSSLPAKVFFFEGIDLIKPFRGDIFYHLLTICQKKKVLNNILERERPSQIWVQRVVAPATNRYSFFDEFVEDVVPERISVNYFGRYRDTLSKEKHIHPSAHIIPLLLKVVEFYNSMISGGGKKILVFSDLHKIPVFLDTLHRRQAVFLRESLPMRHIRYLVGRGSEIRLFDDFSIKKDQEELITYTRIEFLRKMKTLETGLTVEGINLVPYAKQFVMNMWEKCLDVILKRAIQAKMLLEGDNFRCILLDEDRSVINNVLVQAARLRGCPTLVNMHGEPDHMIAYVPLDADKISVWGRRQESILLNWVYQV